MADDDQDEPFIRAWEDRNMREMQRELGPIFRQHGVGAVDRRHVKAERNRVERILGNDRAYHAQERLRAAALIQVENGDFTNIRDTVVEPTPEQFAQATRAGSGFRKFTPRQPDGTVRTVTAYRRKDLPQVQRLILSGVIDAAGFRDCLWYRNLYETTGLTGSFGSVDYGREVFTAPNSRSVFTDHQAEQQDEFRAVRRLISTRLLTLLDKVVLEDVPVYRAARPLGWSWRKAGPAFRSAVDELAAARELLKQES